jgi:hypothetical protein
MSGECPQTNAMHVVHCLNHCMQEWRVAGADSLPLRSPLFVPWFKIQCALLDAWKGASEGLMLGKTLTGILF